MKDLMFIIPSPNYKTRLLIIVGSITLLIWSGLEDNLVSGVVVLGWILTLFSIAFLIMSRFGGQILTSKTILKLSPFIGASIGALASLVTVLLMLFKDVRHAHVFPDYPPQMMLAILERLPVWSIGSGFIVFGIALYLHLICAEKGDKSNADSVTM